MVKNVFLLSVILLLTYLGCAMEPEINDLYPLKISGKYGFINVQGKLVIKPEFEYAEKFSDGLALVNKDGTYGFINAEGKLLFVFPGITSLTWIHSFSDGLASVHTESGWGYIDTTGQFVIPPRYIHAGDFNEGVAPVTEVSGGNYIYIDKTGKNVFPSMSFTIAYEKSNGYMVVGQRIHENYYEDIEWEGIKIQKVISGIRRGVIDSKDKIVIPIEHSSLGIAVSDGIISCGGVFKDMNNNTIITTQFPLSGRFYKGIVPVSTDGTKYGLIDKKGNYILPEQFDIIQTFSSDMAVFVQDDKYGFLDMSGKIAIPAEFDFAMSFDGDLAFIRKNGIDGYVTKTGQIYLATDYEDSHNDDIMQTVVNNGELLPLHSEIRIEELKSLSKDELRILRNTIYAKYGYQFQSNDLKNHFSQFSWYTGITANVDAELSEIDKKNIQLIQRIEANIP